MEINGIGYAVLMASGADLADLATGFLLTERLASGVGEIGEIDTFETDKGWIVRVNLNGAMPEKLAERARTRVSEGSCGLCGIENLDALARPLPAVADHDAIEPGAIFRAIESLPQHQPANAATGGMHAAAFCAADGAILAVREDAGRHNALDKLVGACARAGLPLAPGFLLTTSRCSYEIVEKAVVAGATALATVSAPTDLAVKRALDAGLSLHALARPDSFLDFSSPDASG